MAGHKSIDPFGQVLDIFIYPEERGWFGIVIEDSGIAGIHGVYKRDIGHIQD